MAAALKCSLPISFAEASTSASSLLHPKNESRRNRQPGLLGNSKRDRRRLCLAVASSSGSLGANCTSPLTFDAAPMPLSMNLGEVRGGPPSLDAANYLLKQRIIFLSGQVDDNSADLAISQLLLLDAMDPTKDIKFFINSPGGSVTAGMGIYDAMKLCQADVSTICFGLAASMGAFLLTAGTRGKRFCMPNARVMIHQPLGGIGGTATEVTLQMREMMYHKVKLNKIMARCTGKAEEQLENDADRDYFMDAWEAKEYGLVDGVINEDMPGLVAPRGKVVEPGKEVIPPQWVVRDITERLLNLPSEDKRKPVAP